MKILAHRGARQQAEDNSWEAFKIAQEMGVDGVELDVRQTSDGQLALFHDRCLANRQEVSQLTFSQIQNELSYDLLTLDRAVDSFDFDIWNVEMKEWSGWDQTLPLLEKLIQKERRVVVTSFEHQGLVAASETLQGKESNIEFGALLASNLQLDSEAYFTSLYSSGLSTLVFELGPLSKEMIQRVKSLGFSVWVYSAFSDRDFNWCREQGLEAVITDHPSEYLKLKN